MSVSIRNGNAQIIGASGVIETQSGILETVLREGAGLYLVTMAARAQIAPATCLRAQAVNAAGPGTATLTTAVERVSQSQCRVRMTSNNGVGGVAADNDFVFTTTGVQFG